MSEERLARVWAAIDPDCPFRDEQFELIIQTLEQIDRRDRERFQLRIMEPAA